MGEVGRDLWLGRALWSGADSLDWAPWASE